VRGALGLSHLIGRAATMNQSSIRGSEPHDYDSSGAASLWKRDPIARRSRRRTIVRWCGGAGRNGTSFQRRWRSLSPP